MRDTNCFKVASKLSTEIIEKRFFASDSLDKCS